MRLQDRTGRFSDHFLFLMHNQILNLKLLSWIAKSGGLELSVILKVGISRTIYYHEPCRITPMTGRYQDELHDKTRIQSSYQASAPDNIPTH
jgi:hypothetical protein